MRNLSCHGAIVICPQLKPPSALSVFFFFIREAHPKQQCTLTGDADNCDELSSFMYVRVFVSSKKMKRAKPRLNTPEVTQNIALP